MKKTLNLNYFLPVGTKLIYKGDSTSIYTKGKVYEITENNPLSISTDNGIKEPSTWGSLIIILQNFDVLKKQKYDNISCILQKKYAESIEKILNNMIKNQTKKFEESLRIIVKMVRSELMINRRKLK